ncbi:hypothetical protein [Methylobacter sp. YRD-M1]|uniref:hypothetical protein n=1 Tax=Methylobacter sp. YRD-M1 TaxID=2911520 RepID=UPI00227B69AB|nr:hypothetical protein [Methylobacter sp. YRD-M1]WAK00828.1 hypothetical protein LZ558_13370 [Methylobacter sp. YRD-M1]
MKLHITGQWSENPAQTNSEREDFPSALTHYRSRYWLRHSAVCAALLSARAIFNSHRVYGQALGGRYDSAVIDSGHCQAPERSRNENTIAVHACAKQLRKLADPPSGQARILMGLNHRPKPIRETEEHGEYW